MSSRGRLSRPCYDKPGNCPGWSGGGLKYAKTNRCDNGRIRIPVGYDAETMLAVLSGTLDDHPGSHPFRFGRCDTCNVITWPWITRRLDPTLWWSVTQWSLQRLRWKVQRIRRTLRSKIGNR